MTCWETIHDYGLRSIGIGERQLPKGVMSLCEQFTLIGSGLIWNVYFGVLALLAGFIFATMLGLGKGSHNVLLRKSSEWIIFVFRSSPLFIQLFFGYFLFLSLKSSHPIFHSLPEAWFGALIVLFLNTSAYSGEIFFGALRSIPKSDVESADAYGFTGWRKFRRIIWPTMLRLAWPAYTNEAIFIFHSTTLVFFSAFPTWQQRGDALYYANYFADKTFNPFIAYPILAGYFILLTLIILGIFGVINRRLNRHLLPNDRIRQKFSINIFR